MPQTSKVKELIDQYSKSLPRHEVEIALSHLLGINRMQLHSQVIDDALITTQVKEELAEIISQRLAGNPLQYILGTAPFRYLELEVGPGVLIPRPETEMLVDIALHQLSSFPDQTAPISVIDAGSGSGAIAISLASETLGKKKLSLIAVEKSEAALPYLEKNIAKYAPDIRVVKQDIKDALANIKADVFLANPPYVAMTQKPNLPADLEYEPEIALFGGDDGIFEIKIFIESAVRLLKNGGFFLMEHGADQGEILETLLQENFKEIKHFQDLTGRIRFTSAFRK